jgi:hypothetical protein
VAVGDEPGGAYGEAAMATRWSELNPRVRKALVVGGVIEAALKAIALNDLRRRPNSQIRGPKWLWTASTLVNSAGILPTAYLLVGRKPTR